MLVKVIEPLKIFPEHSQIFVDSSVKVVETSKVFIKMLKIF